MLCVKLSSLLEYLLKLLELLVVLSLHLSVLSLDLVLEESLDFLDVLHHGLSLSLVPLLNSLLNVKDLRGELTCQLGLYGFISLGNLRHEVLGVLLDDSLGELDGSFPALTFLLAGSVDKMSFRMLGVPSIKELIKAAVV